MQPLLATGFTFSKSSQVPTILAIDDGRIGLAARQKLLESAGYTVLAASDAAQGLRLFEDHEVDLVLMDDRKPGQDPILQRLNDSIANCFSTCAECCSAATSFSLRFRRSTHSMPLRQTTVGRLRQTSAMS